MTSFFAIFLVILGFDFLIRFNFIVAGFLNFFKSLFGLSYMFVVDFFALN